jgi:hypothetical protein
MVRTCRRANTAQQVESEVLRQWLADRDDTIRDLRQRLDAADHRLTALLGSSALAADQQRSLGSRILAWLIKQHV